MYWLPKRHKRRYKPRFTANPSSCTTTELSKLLTSCLTAIKAKVIKYCETVFERSGKNIFWSLRERLRTHNVFTKDQYFYLNYHKFSIKSYVLDVYSNRLGDSYTHP